MSIISGTHYIYTVKPGDTLYAIANRFASSPQVIAQTNALYPPVTNPGLIYPGQILVVPSNLSQGTSTFYVVNPGDHLYHIALRFTKDIELIAGINPSINDPGVIFSGQAITVPALIYQVEPSDTLYKMEQRFGVHRSEIIRANLGRPGFSPDVIWPGYGMIIPLPASDNIAISTPFPGTVIQSGQSLSGWARAFEGNVLHHVRDENGVIVSAEQSVTANQGAPNYGRFESSLPFNQQPTANKGEIWVYTRSAATGEVQDLVQVRVFFDSIP